MQVTARDVVGHGHGMYMYGDLGDKPLHRVVAVADSFYDTRHWSIPKVVGNVYENPELLPKYYEGEKESE